MVYMIINGGIGGGPDGRGVIGTNDLPDALTWMICELGLLTKDWSTTNFPSLYSF